MNILSKVYYKYKKLLKVIRLFLIIAGPGIIVMVADNDAGGITTYTATGAKYSFHLIWFLILLGPVAYYVQEMTVRLGAVTKRGHAEAIFHAFGSFWGWFSLLDLVMLNWLTMMMMKWKTSEDGRLVATWHRSRRAAPDCANLPEAAAREPMKVGGPPGRAARIFAAFATLGTWAKEFCRIQWPVHAGVSVRLQNSGGTKFTRRRGMRRLNWAVILACLMLLTCLPLRAQDGGTVATKPSDPAFDLHFQSTLVGQGVLPFAAQYSGPNSLEPHGEIRDTFSFDVTGDVRLWHGAQFSADALIWQGYGLSKTTGVAAFPNGEAYRAGKTYPDAIITRAYLRQTISFGGEHGSGAGTGTASDNSQRAPRLNLMVGHFSVTDVFDRNIYANDPRRQFMNWGFVNNLAWDYPANTLGFTNGVTAELEAGSWAMRAGIVQDSRVANAIRLDWNLRRAWSLAGELEKRYSFWGHPGAVRLLSYDTKAHMGNYQQSLSNPQSIGDNGQRGYRSKYGFGINLQQEIGKDVGAFARLGWSDGKNQSWEFTDVDRTASAGISLKGEAWRRAGDSAGAAVAVNGISAVHREFLAAGGVGITAGDGRLNYATERVLEAYYSIATRRHIWISPDFQLADHPAYNRDRGPALIYAVRLHWEK